MLNYGLIVKPQNMVKHDPCLMVFWSPSGEEVRSAWSLTQVLYRRFCIR